MLPSINSPPLSIPITPLTGSAFRLFGEVIENPSSHPDALPRQTIQANQGSATKVQDVTRLTSHYHRSSSRTPANPTVNLFVCRPRELSQRQGDGKSVFPVRILERHPFTPQTFVPMGLSGDGDKTAYLVVVAPTLPVSRKEAAASNAPPYPLPERQRRPSLRERLLGARPNPFTNDHTPTTTPYPSADPSDTPKGPGMPDLSRMQAFVARGNQAVTYGPGTWHAPMVVLGQMTVEFVVVQFASGIGGEDCQEVEVLAEGGGEGVNVVVGDEALGEVKGVRAKL